MIINEVDPNLRFDEFPDEGDHFAYILSRPMSLAGLEYSSSLLIYTTPQIKRIIINDLTDRKVADCIQGLNNHGIPHIRRISNGTEIEIKVLPTQSATQNVMFLIKNNDGQTILYTGVFTEYRSIQFHNANFIESGANKEIAHLFIDNTLSKMNPMQCYNSIRKTCNAIRDLLEQFEGYKLHLMLETIGYEDLLVALARMYEKQIYLDRVRSNIIHRDLVHMFTDSIETSKIRVKTLDMDIPTPLAEIEKQFIEEKIISVKFTTEEIHWLPMLNNYRSNVYSGLCLIQYSPHPSPIELMDFIESTNATKIHSINFS